MKIVHVEGEDLGPALAVEDALTVMVVILVLRMVLLVPMMSLDKARLERPEKEGFWERAYSYILGHKEAGAVKGAQPYADAFEIDGNAVILSDVGGSVRFVESADANNNLLVVRHDVGRQTYHSMYIQNFSAVPSFSHGKMKWSPQEKKWFRLNNEIDYTQTPESAQLQAQYAELNKQRGLQE